MQNKIQNHSGSRTVAGICREKRHSDMAPDVLTPCFTRPSETWHRFWISPFHLPMLFKGWIGDAYIFLQDNQLFYQFNQCCKRICVMMPCCWSPGLTCNAKKTNSITRFITGLKCNLSRFNIGYSHPKTINSHCSRSIKLARYWICEIRIFVISNQTFDVIIFFWSQYVKHVVYTTLKFSDTCSVP